jgi:hypothetical protein
MSRLPCTTSTGAGGRSAGAQRAGTVSERRHDERAATARGDRGVARPRPAGERERRLREGGVHRDDDEADPVRSGQVRELRDDPTRACE